MSFGHQDNPPNPFSGEDVQQHGFNGKHRDWSINQYERLDEKKPGNAKDMELQSCKRKKSAGNDQDSQSQPRNDQNKTAKTTKCNCRHQQAATEPSRPKEKTESRKTEGESEDDTVGTEGLSIRLGRCYRPAKRQRVNGDHDSPNLLESVYKEKRPNYRTCFGSIMTDKILLNILANPGTRNVTLDTNADLVLLRDPESAKYLGMVKHGSDISSAITAIHNDSRINSEAVGVLAPTGTHLEIQIYGSRSDGSVVSEILNARNIFLQEPGKASAPYVNPQSLSSLLKSLGNTSNNGMEGNKIMAVKMYDFMGTTNVPTQFKKVDVNKKLLTQLKGHQEVAVAMMVEKESGNLQQQNFPSLWSEEVYDVEQKLFKNNITGDTQLHPPQLCLGGILADEMGLGKTLSTLALVVATAGNPQTSIISNPEDQRTLIVAPLSTLGSWEEEIKRHIKPGLISYTIYHGNKRHLVPFNEFSIVLTTYETVKADRKREAETSDAMANSLHHQIWHRVILDEAHIIRNRRSKIFRVVCDLKARHRWCLTGTPVQNQLDDFGALLEFLNVYPFHTSRTFSRILPDWRTGGSASDWRRLTSLFRAVALRRTKESISSELDLPGRKILYQPVKLNESESKFYDKLKQAYILGSGAGGNPITSFQIILRLRQVCDHGLDLLPSAIRKWLENDEASCDAPIPDVCELCEESMESDNRESPQQEWISCLHMVCDMCRADRFSDKGSDSGCPLCSGNSLVRNTTTPGSPDDSQLRNYVPSSKVEALLENLDRNSIVFSYWTRMLDLIGQALSAKDIPYQRLDGSKDLHQRRHAIKAFCDGASYPVMLASLGSAALGLNLTAANEVHLMEPGWNPKLEQQALDRVYRLGQQRPVRAVYYIAQTHGSVDELILCRQEQKIQLCSMSVDATDNRKIPGQDIDSPIILE
ncbi:hypothetical protein BFJ67_g14743 [Fusarium oxysporum f. sp. cepae]|nr:hypothetical protein BFJ67_g14743 [Fusarium oxysporum f. sp. cepae]